MSFLDDGLEMYFINYHIFLLLLSVSLLHASPLEKLAVLPLNQSIQLKQEELLYLTSQIQEKVQQGLLSQYQVMTQENIMTLLPPQTKLEDCIQAACTIDTGILLGVSLIMSGQIFKQSKPSQQDKQALVLQLQLYDTQQRKQKGTFSTTVSDVVHLEAELDQLIPQLLNEILSIKKETQREMTEVNPVNQSSIDQDQPLKNHQQYEALFKKIAQEERQKKEKYQEISKAWSVFTQEELKDYHIYQLQAFKTQYQSHPFYPLFEERVNGQINRLIAQSQQRFFKKASYDWALIKKALKILEPQQLVKAITLFIQAYDQQIPSNPYQEEATLLLALIESAQPLPQDILLIDWVRIQGGHFQMAEDVQKIYQSYSVQLDDFYVSKTEITVAQYLKCVEAKHCTPPHWDDLLCQDGLMAQAEELKFKACSSQHHHRLSCQEDLATDELAPQFVRVEQSLRQAELPVVCVDWEQAKSFTTWIGGDLPTEEQWEYMAKSQGKSWDHPMVSQFQYGDCEHIVMANQQGLGCGKNQPWPVCAQAGHTEQGLCDLLGNAWEWVKKPALVPQPLLNMDNMSLSEQEKAMLADRPCGFPNCRTYKHQQQVIRGGGWQNPINQKPTFSSRKQLFAIESFTDVGFRVVRPIFAKPIREYFMSQPPKPTRKQAPAKTEKFQKSVYEEELKRLQKALEFKDKNN